jgi:6-phosphogluconate dehydrogenase
MKEFGVIGLGRIGGGLSLQALEKRFRVVGFDKAGASSELKSAGLVAASDIKDLVKKLSPRRVLFLYVSAGKIVDDIIEELSDLLAKGDVIVDGGNSYWGDSITRHKRCRERGIGFVDLGTSGGVEGARRGACFMAGGVREDVGKVDPILKALSVPGGYVHAGGPGAGHFVKLVHNGIEFGMLQAIGEGMDLLLNYKDKLDIEGTLAAWNNGSIIESRLIELIGKMYRQKNIEDVPSYIEDTGEVNWLVSDALMMEVPIPVISQSVMQLFASRDNKKYWARAIAMMRHAFGGHPFGPDDAIREERQKGRGNGGEIL